MPFKSEAQRKLFYAKAARGEISPETVREWEEHTPKKKLPERVHPKEKKASLAETLTWLAVTKVATLLKKSDHADDRLKERIRAALPPDTLDNLRDQIKGLKVDRGRYYFNINDERGERAAVAAFKTVGPDGKLVLATVLKPKDKPPRGVSLGDRLKQPARYAGGRDHDFR